MNKRMLDLDARESGRMFSREFRARLKELDLTLYALARKTGMSYSSLWQVSQSMVLPGEKRLRRLCHVLGWKYEDVLPLYPEAGPKKSGRPPGSAVPGGMWEAGAKEFGATVRDWQIQSQLSDTEVCQRARLTFGYWFGLRRGKKRIPSYAIILRIASALGKKPRRLVMLRLIGLALPKYRGEVAMALLPDEKELIAACDEG